MPYMAAGGILFPLNLGKVMQEIKHSNWYTLRPLILMCRFVKQNMKFNLNLLFVLLLISKIMTE